MATTFKIKGVDKLISKIQQMDESVQKEAKLLVFDAATDIEVEALAKVPMRTKTLRNSINKLPVNNAFGAIVSANTDYAVFVEFGTKYQRAQPYLTPAFLRVSKEFVSDLKALLKRQKI